jgi:hypothetical protein
MLANWSLPSSDTDSPRASTKTDRSARVASLIRAPRSSASGNRADVFATMAPVGTFDVDTTATVRPGAVTARFLVSAATSRSQPR